MTRIKRLEMKQKQKAKKEAWDKENKDYCVYIYEQSEVDSTEIKAYKEGIPTPEYVQWLENYTENLFSRLRDSKEREHEYYNELEELKNEVIPKVREQDQSIRELESRMTQLEKTP